ncbi:hypothetical protein BS47DRAFT_1359688 [Hydnum rufescens UP504]|uniref:Alpha/beta-hydrolase n=1 Tax=Hydnum rufescens UP504 TaxID=1448309 RepID=A0A9P6B4B6_9AGAM|nr:hypothetical protein BS47DRAFT_1359688 [Hydnum rufescens UP504]
MTPHKSAHTERAEGGFFSTRSVRAWEFEGDDESFVLVHGPDSPGGNLEMLPLTRNNDVSPRPIITTIWKWTFSATVTTYIAFLPLVILSLAVPIASFFALPILLYMLAVLFYAIPTLSYLFLAQISPPPHMPRPFRPQIGNVRQLFRINTAIARWTRRAVILAWTVGPEIFTTKVLYTISKGWSGRVKTNVSYGSPYAANKLDIYLPKPSPQLPPSAGGGTVSRTPHSTEVTKAPIIIFVPAPQYGGIRSRKWMLASLGRNLARMGYCIVIPDIVAFGDEMPISTAMTSKLKDARTTRLVSIYSDFGGDNQKIFLAGHGSGSAAKPPVSISNGMRRVQEYGKEIQVPQIEGLILLSPICDVEKQVLVEIRRSLGPGQLPCIMHSPAHILHASRNVIDVGALPRNILFVHGGFDRVVNWSQSENMKELLRGVGVENVRSRVYATGHTGVLTALMGHTRDTVLSPIFPEKPRSLWLECNLTMRCPTATNVPMCLESGSGHTLSIVAGWIIGTVTGATTFYLT